MVRHLRRALPRPSRRRRRPGGPPRRHRGGGRAGLRRAGGVAGHRARRPGGGGARCGRGPLPRLAALEPRRPARPRRDLRVGLGRAGPHRGREGRRVREDPARARGSRPSATCCRPIPDRCRRGRRRLAPVAPGRQRRRDRPPQRHPVRHPRRAAPLRHRHPARGQRGGAVLHARPTEDLSEPGRTWFPALGRTMFATWDDVTTCYHEAVPGHHLQLGGTRLAPLIRAHRLGFHNAHGEGWALYAERLMDELGFFDTPDTRLGFLSSQGVPGRAGGGRHRPAHRPPHPRRLARWRRASGRRQLAVEAPEAGRRPDADLRRERGAAVPELARPGHHLQARRADVAREPRGRPSRRPAPTST